MVDGKTIAGLTANLSSEAALRRLLKARLAAVQKRARGLAGDPDSIHQLRVATRRAAAALRLGKANLPARKRQAAAAVLRDLRRTAGRVRDHDIYIHHVEKAGIGEVPKAFLIGLRAQRRWLDLQLFKARLEYHKDTLTRMAQKVTAAVKPGKPETFQKLITRESKRLFVQFHDAVTDAGSHLDPEHLHCVRIQAKRLRYTLELAVGDTRRSAVILAQVEKLQDILGEWHDAHTLIPKFEASAEAAASVNGKAGSPVSRAIATLIRDTKRREARQLQLFRRWLAGWAKIAKRNPPKVLFPKAQATSRA